MLLLITPIGRMGFNPRTRVECDYLNDAYTPEQLVSIRALAWSAILSWLWAKIDDLVSIRALAWSAIIRDTMCHAPAGVSIRALAWSAILMEGAENVYTWRFNPRTRVECDSQLCVN